MHHKKPIMILTELNHNQTFDVVNGQEVLIQLEENPSTGWIWVYEDVSKDFVKELEHNFHCDDDSIGSKGTLSCKFQCIDVGEAKVWFNYLRPWITNKPPDKTFFVNFNIKKAI
jgi:inhibitor of cysteine peptidase